jgi:hypothetical protein
MDKTRTRIAHNRGKQTNELIRKHDTARFDRAYLVIVKKLENTIVYYKQTLECRHLIYWPIRQQRVNCHTETLEPTWSVSIDEVSF